MNIKKRSIYLAIFLLILVIVCFAVNASIMHLGHDFEIKINDEDMTLQDAVNNDLFTDFHNYALPSLIPDPGHGPDEIWVSVDGDEKTLQDALLTINGLCGSSTIPYLGPTDPSDLSKAYHFASEIEISSGKTLQDAIDNGDFCCVADYTQACGLCGGVTQCDGTCSIATPDNYGDACPIGICSTLGAFDCDGNCVGGAVKAYGAVCDNILGGGSYFWYVVCDGVGTGSSSCNRIIAWYAGEWGACDYATVTQTRDVSCYIFDSLDPNTGNPETLVAESTCLMVPGGKPATTQACDFLIEGTGCASCPWDYRSRVIGIGDAWRICILNGNKGRYLRTEGWSAWTRSETETSGPVCKRYGCYCAYVPGVCIFSGWCWKDFTWQIAD